MQTAAIPKQQQFVTAFFNCSLDPNLQSAQYAIHPQNYFITDLALVAKDFQVQDRNMQLLPLNGSYSLLISRNHKKKPIIDIANYDQIPQGWEAINIQNCPNNQAKQVVCFKRGQLNQNQKGIFSIQLIEGFQQEKTEQTTQPSFTENSQLIHSYIKIQIEETKFYVSLGKKSQIQIENLRFKPQLEILFQNKQREIDIPNSAVLCFPEGVKIFKKQTGFKFFSFIITTDCAQRYYCNSIIFSQKCSVQTSFLLYEKYGIKNERGIFKQKVFTLVSKYNCTDHTNRCLQYLYRVYLTNSQANFKQKIYSLRDSFLIDPFTHKSKYITQNFGIYFKINSSYPQTSVQAIYSVFKFLQVQNIVTVLQNILLERKIFFVSNCQNIIGLAIQAFLSFIYPLDWIHGIINPLSSAMIQYTEAPMTIIFGLKNQLIQKIKPQVDGLFVYLDYNRVELRNNPQLSFMPNLRNQLIKRLRQFSAYDKIDVRDYLSNPQNLSLFKTQKTQDPHFDPYKIRNIFFQLTVFMLRNYKQYFIKKFKKDEHQFQKSKGGLRNYYDIDSLLSLYKKDQFMLSFIQTTLFSVLIEKKNEQSNNKWIKTLDRAIKKISGQKKQLYIKQQSDYHSDTNQLQQKQAQYIPKGCLNLLNFTSKSSDEQKPKSSPSPKKYIQDQNFVSPVSSKIQSGRMSLQNEYQIRQSTNNSDNKYKKRLSDERAKKDNTSQQKSDKETDKGSQSCGKSDQIIPQLRQNHEVIVYQFDVQCQEGQQGQKISMKLCTFITTPYRKMSNLVVTKWTKAAINKLKFWKKNKKINKDVDRTAQKSQSFKEEQQIKKNKINYSV